MKKEYIGFNDLTLLRIVFNRIGGIVKSQAQSNMDKTSFGRVYRIRGRRHIASKRGDTANNLSGDLRRSIGYDIRGDTMEFGAGNNKINYAKALEMGLNRPNIEKSVDQNMTKIRYIVQNGLSSSVYKKGSPK